MPVYFNVIFSKNIIMKKIFCSLLLALLILPRPAAGQDSPSEKGMKSITEDVIKAQLGFLASDWTEGREAGQKGEYMASDYIASMLQLYGIKPGGDYVYSRSADGQRVSTRSYFQNFVLLKSIPGDDPVLKVSSGTGNFEKTTGFAYKVDFVVYPSYPSVEIEAPVVFAGYCFKNDKLKYNDFSNLNVKGKYILKITGIPAFAKEKLTSDEISASMQEVNKYIHESGAAGIIEFNPTALVAGSPEAKTFLNPSPSEREAIPPLYNIRYSLPDKNVPVSMYRVFVSARTAAIILEDSGIVPEEYIKKADMNLAYQRPVSPGKTIYLKTDVKTTQVAVRNVIGVIEGNNPDKVVVLGAHYDHLGMSDGYLWNGADDNGSGTVGVMTMARAIMATGKKPEKTVIIALWTAEEEGLYGSHYYVNNLPYPAKNIELNVNYDMISRYISNDNPKGVVLVYTKSFPQFKDMTEANIKKYGIDIVVDYQPSDDPPGGSDHRSFVEIGVPVMRFKTAHPPEYHMPNDEVRIINWDIMEKIIRISFANVWDIIGIN
jgi:hypothetical protein